MSRWIIIWRSLKREVCSLNTLFAETLRKLRSERGLSQKQLGEKLFVNHSTVARWENGTRLPDAAMISRLSSCLGVDVNTLLNLEEQSDESPNVILVDDSRAVLSDAVTVLGEVLPNATITGFVWPREAIEYARTNRVALAFLDIEMGKRSGLTVCKDLLDINPKTNVVFLTAYEGYSLDAWNTGASGFLMKPLTVEAVQKQLPLLRNRIRGLSNG